MRTSATQFGAIKMSVGPLRPKMRDRVSSVAHRHPMATVKGIVGPRNGVNR